MSKRDKSDYPDAACDVEVVFTDGQIATYRISASCGITPHLARQAGETGILTLLNGELSHCIPVAQIRQWSVQQVPNTAETQ